MKSLSTYTADFIVIGAGIIGLTIAREIKYRYPDSHVIILEKEKNIGEHSSGRNSGVLHAGFYYTHDSLKAKFTKKGNEALTAYCLEKKIPLNCCGKLVVARDQHDLPGLRELLKRGQQNNINLALITAQEALELEPRVKTFEQALFSPTTSSVNPMIVLKHMLEDAKQQKITIHFDEEYKKIKNNEIITNKRKYSYGFLINAAGLYADKIAKNFGFSNDYVILPFKGLYLYASPSAGTFKRHIYPVPNLTNPFLGVHFTLSHDGHVKIGPTAIPAFWREQYAGWSSFNINEMLAILFREIALSFSAGFNFKQLAWNELKKYNRTILTKHAAELAIKVEKHHFQTWGKPGIRAQLLNIKNRKLEMDFILEGDKKSLHVLNAVSPAFTCSIPFATFVVDEIDRKLSGSTFSKSRLSELNPS